MSKDSRLQISKNPVRKLSTHIFSRLQIVVENDYGGKVAVPLAHQLGYITCYANNNNGPRWSANIIRVGEKYKQKCHGLKSKFGSVCSWMSHVLITTSIVAGSQVPNKYHWNKLKHLETNNLSSIKVSSREYWSYYKSAKRFCHLLPLPGREVLRRRTSTTRWKIQLDVEIYMSMKWKVFLLTRFIRFITKSLFHCNARMENI